MYTALYQTTTNLQQLFFFFFHLATFFLEKGYQPLVTLARRQNQGPRCCIDSRRLSKKKKISLMSRIPATTIASKINEKLLRYVHVSRVCALCRTQQCTSRQKKSYRSPFCYLKRPLCFRDKTVSHQRLVFLIGSMQESDVAIATHFRATAKCWSLKVNQAANRAPMVNEGRLTRRGRKKIYKPDCIFTACQKKAKNSSTVPRTATSLMHTSGTRKLLNTDATEGNKYKFNLAYNTWENEAAVYILSIKMTF